MSLIYVCEFMRLESEQVFRRQPTYENHSKNKRDNEIKRWTRSYS